MSSTVLKVLRTNQVKPNNKAVCKKAKPWKNQTQKVFSTPLRTNAKFYPKGMKDRRQLKMNSRVRFLRKGRDNTYLLFLNAWGTLNSS